MTTTRPPGRLWPIDARGYILNDARPEYIRPPFDNAVRGVVQACVGHIEADLDSLYITGSVARGRAVEGDSDLNAFAVLDANSDPELVLRDWIPAAENALRVRHPCVSDVHIELWPYFSVFSDPARFAIAAFILKTHSVCVWGVDLSSQLPDYPISPAIANDDLVQLAFDLEDAADAIRAAEDAFSVRLWTRYAARCLLWSAFGLVQMQAGVHTRDVDLCAEYALRYLPDAADDLRLALEYTAAPPISAADALRFLDTAGQRMLRRADAWLDRYNPARDLALPVDDVEENE